MSKSKNAIKTLNRHLLELDNITDVQQGNTWKASLRDTLSLYIGPNSAMLVRLDGLYFTRKEFKAAQQVIGVLEAHIYDDSKKEGFRQLILNAIAHIESNGIHIDRSGNNFLSGFNSAQIIGGAFAAALIVFAIGTWVGLQEKKSEIIDLNKAMDSKDGRIRELVEGQNAELNALKLDNKNVWDSYHRIYDELEALKKKKK